jgi:hypothetical protein
MEVIMKKNVIVWGIQSTVDYAYQVVDNLPQIARDWLKEGTFPSISGLLRGIAQTGLAQDRREDLGEKRNPGEVADELKRAQDWLRQKKYKESTKLGGNPIISAVRGHYLTAGAKQSTLPQNIYAGLLPKSVEEYLEDHPELNDVFRGRIPVQAWPKTVALEARTRKLILVDGCGRRLDDPALEGSFNQFLDEYMKEIDKIVTEFSGRVTVIALSVPRPVELGAQLIDALKERFKDKMKIFVGTSSFRKGQDIDEEDTLEIYNKILKKADIVSCNEQELDDLHTVVVGGRAYQQDVSLAYKLKQLPLQGIKVCHSADGAMLELGCNPEPIIRSDEYPKNPHEFLEDALRLSVDGATYTIDALEVGQTANESMIKVYSASVTDRSTELFRTTFLKTVERLPAGIIAVPAPLVARRLATLTGIGAIFDGLLVSFLMRD